MDFAGDTVRVRASYADGALTTPKSGKVRSVPMAPEVATALAKLGRRRYGTEDDDLVFLGDFGGYVDGSALRRRYDAAVKAAGLRPDHDEVPPLRAAPGRRAAGGGGVSRLDGRDRQRRGPAARRSADPGTANDRQDGVPCGMANLRNQTS